MSQPQLPPSDGDWLAWCDTFYPFDPKWETILLVRQPDDRATPQSQSELNDLRGIRSREQAALLASVWFHIRARSEKSRAKTLGATTRELDEIDEAIGARYD
jgi:hypothetical protein